MKVEDGRKYKVKSESNNILILVIRKEKDLTSKHVLYLIPNIIVHMNLHKSLSLHTKITVYVDALKINGSCYITWNFGSKYFLS